MVSRPESPEQAEIHDHGAAGVTDVKRRDFAALESDHARYADDAARLGVAFGHGSDLDRVALGLQVFHDRPHRVPGHISYRAGWL